MDRQGGIQKENKTSGIERGEYIDSPYINKNVTQAIGIK